MADWNGEQLFSDPDGQPRRSGALLELATPAKKPGFAKLEDASVQVIPGTRDLIIRFEEEIDLSNLATQAVRVGSQGLDLLGADRGEFLNVGMTGESDLVWSAGSTGSRVRATLRTPLAFRFSLGPVQVIGPDGEVVPQPPPPQPVPHESFRYLRLSQCTDDLFDAFRNAWLALESALADLHPKPSRQPEGVWLKHAITQAQALVNVHAHLDCTAAEAPGKFHDDIYKGVRCPLFHGKAFGLDPASDSDRQRVFSAYEVVMKSYFALAANRYGLRTGGGGGLTAEGFAPLVTVMSDWSVRAGVGTDEHDYGELSALTAAPIESQPQHALRFSIAAAPFPKPLDAVNFIGAFHEDALAYWHTFKGLLTTQDLDSLEVLIDLWNSVDTGYRRSFAG